MEPSPACEVFPVHRYMCRNDHPYYYPYCETRPEDFLHSVHKEKQPEVLLLGCGDLASCFYTLWKNFKSGVTREFDGVHFVLNDISAAVLARNLLFLHLCLKMPEEEESALRKWVSAVWAIWYSHELLPEHQHVLDDAISTLITLSKSLTTWSRSDNPLKRFVIFSSPHTLSKLRDMWMMWDKMEVGSIPVKRMHAARLTDQKKQLSDLHAVCMGVLISSVCTALMPCISNDLQGVMKQEVADYYSTGMSFAEEVLADIPVTTAGAKTTLNSTFFDREDGKYSMHYALVPYKAFDHTINFTKQELTPLAVSKTTIENLLVKDSHFISHPILSNSVQQFSIWLRSCANILKQMNSSTGLPPITFTLHCADALKFCIRLQNPDFAKSLNCPRMFDVVHTSDLMDTMAPPNLVLSVLPIVKPGNLVFTITRQYKFLTETIEEYLQLTFGVAPEFLPVLFGVRCHDHEGDPYTSGVAMQHEPYNYSHVTATKYWTKVLIWERISCLPFKHHALLEKCDVITRNLCSAVCNATMPLVSSTKGHTTLNNISIETAMLVLHSFASRVQGDTNSHLFWKPLVSLLSETSDLKPHKHCLQTQALLHGIHFHLTVDKGTCPICRAKPITNNLTQVRISFETYLLPLSPCFFIYIHRGAEGFEQASSLQHMATLNRSVVQVMDSVNGVMEGGKVTLDFFVPLHFVRENYNFTVLSYVLARVLKRDVEVPTIITVKRLADHKMSLTYNFHRTPAVDPAPVTPLGALAVHVGDMKSFETVISACESEIPFFSSLSPHRESPSEVHLSIQSHKYVITYPYPVDYDNLSIKLSRKQETITVLASRTSYSFELEKPMYVFNTSDEFTNLHIPMNKQTMLTFNGMQFSQAERAVLNSGVSHIALEAAMICCKQSLNYFFQCQKEHYFNLALSEDNVQAVIVVQDRVFDLQNHSPVVDLAYCFLDRSFVTTVALKWQSVAPLESTRCITVDENELKMFKKVFSFFARRTVGRSLTKTKGHFQVLKSNKIDQYFTRAVVYPLYADPQSYVKQIEQENLAHPDFRDFFATGEKVLKKATKPTEEENKTTNTTKGTEEKPPTKATKGTKEKKLTKTTEINEEKKPTETTKVTEEKHTETTKESKRHCANCGEKVNDMKRCANCGRVKYCSRECQKRHWKLHKADCKKFQNEVTVTSSPADITKDSSEGRPTDKDQCSFCTKRFSKLKQCGACGKARYCSEECQKKDWKGHKKVCKRAKGVTPASSSLSQDLDICGGCETKSSNLRPCPCHKIAYCSTICQRMDWSRHKLDCSAAAKKQEVCR